MPDEQCACLNPGCKCIKDAPLDQVLPQSPAGPSANSFDAIDAATKIYEVIKEGKTD